MLPGSVPFAPTNFSGLRSPGLAEGWRTNYDVIFSGGAWVPSLRP